MSPRMTLLLTRPAAQSRAFARDLGERLPGRFAPVISPLLRIAAVSAPVDLAKTQGLIFTSANGVEQFAARCDVRHLPAFCVGAMTAAAATAAGLSARSADGDVTALEALLLGAHRPGAGGFVHVRGRHAAGDLAVRLAAAGVPTRTLEIYDQVPCPLTAEARTLIAARRLEAVALFSPRTARLLAGEVAGTGWDLRGIAGVFLSSAAARAFDAGIGSRIVCGAPSREAMLRALAALGSDPPVGGA